MSERNGDRARFHKNRVRKLHHRQRVRALSIRLMSGRIDAGSDVSATQVVQPSVEASQSTAAALAMESEGGGGIS